MSEIKKAWDTQRPIYSRLPGIQERYFESDLGNWITAFWDRLLIETREKILDVGDRQIDPQTCDPEWLDFLAPLLGWDSIHWDVNYPTQGKRDLLSNSFKGLGIWRNKGTGDVLSFVLTSAGIVNEVKEDSDFIVGVSLVGDPIDVDPWSFTVFLPPEYQYTSLERKARYLIKLFSPAYCEWQIVFDPDRFRVFEVLSSYDGFAIASEDDEAIIAEF